MVAQFIFALERPVSRVRLENYRAGGSDLDMVVNYFYNLELSEALYPALQAFEIALSNSINISLREHFEDSYWFDRPQFLPQWQIDQVSKARSKLSKAGKPLDSDRIIAELHFGFWHSMFNSPFERRHWRPNRSAMIGAVFPGIPAKGRNRPDIWDRCNRIRNIRNRVMHYEPIWARPHLHMDHAESLEALNWISEDMHQSIEMCDRFPQVLIAGRASVQVRIASEILRRFPINIQ